MTSSSSVGRHQQALSESVLWSRRSSIGTTWYFSAVQTIASPIFLASQRVFAVADAASRTDGEAPDIVANQFGIAGHAIDPFLALELDALPAVSAELILDDGAVHEFV